MKKGKERREKVEVCCAVVGTDCRGSEPCFPSRFVVLAAPAASLFLSLSRSISSSAGLFLPLSFCHPSHTRPIRSTTGRHRGPLCDSSPLFVVREEGNRRTSVFPLPSASSRSSLSFHGSLFLHHHHLLLLFLLLSQSPSLVVGNRRYRCSTRTHRHMHIHTHTQHTSATGAHCSRGEPRLFSCRPRFLADFIPIPRNKLADDHGGICLLDDLSSFPRSLLPDLLHHREQTRLFLRLFVFLGRRNTPRALLTPRRVLAAREKGGVAPFLSSRFRPRLPWVPLFLLFTFSSLFAYEALGQVRRIAHSVFPAT